MANLTHIDLQVGCPSTSLCPTSGLLKGASDILSCPKKAADALIYGPGAGYAALRENISEWLTSAYKPCTAISSDCICITNSASANLAGILAKFTEPGYTRKIWMVEPSYFLACPIFTDAGFDGKLRGVPEDDEDIDIAFLRSGLAEDEKNAQQKRQKQQAPVLKTGPRYPKLYRHIIYLVHTFSNPSGKTMSLQRRQELVRLARAFDALIVSDDVYDLLLWPEDRQQQFDATSADMVPPPRLVDIDDQLDGGRQDAWGHTVSNGSFSKIIAPGLRVGWAESTPAFAQALAQVGSTGSGGCPTHLAATFVDEMLRAGVLQDHIRDTLIPTYRSRANAMRDAIRRHLVPLGFEMSAGTPYTRSKLEGNGTNGINGTNGHSRAVAMSGGYFVYLLIPKALPVTAQQLAERALDECNLRVAYGSMFEVQGDPGSAQRAADAGGFGGGFRLCWAWHTEEEIVEGIQRLENLVIRLMRC